MFKAANMDFAPVKGYYEQTWEQVDIGVGL